MNGLLGALEAFHALANSTPNCSSVVVEVRGDGRAEVDFLDGHRRVIGHRRFYRDDDGVWVELPRVGGR